ncbi:MAG: putative DNA binding domain-containing protein [Bacilli bacterium]|nr:putative DNA binding domain-containing protein [Bacilli bacterium]
MNLGKENETLEFKETTSELRQALMDISAILNKHGRGLLYFGVKDWGDVCGMQVGKDTRKTITQEIRAHIKPLCMFEINEMTSDDKTFIEVSFSGDNPPYSAYDRYYLRFDDQSPVMERDQLNSFFLGLNNDYSKWEDDDSGESIDIVDDDFIQNYVNRGNAVNRVTFKYMTKENALKQLHLLHEKGNLNNAGNVLFSSKKPVPVKLAVFAGVNRTSFIDMKVFNGNIFECIEESMNYIKSHLNKSISFDGSVRSKELPEIPYESIREIVVNAFAHGLYKASTNFEICIFKNRLTIYSPGHFPKPYKPEEFAQGDLESIPFNPKIVEVLFGDETIEKYATGFGRAFDYLKDSGVTYDYVDTGNGFRFTFYRNVGGVNGVVKITSGEEKVYDILKQNPNATIRMISEETKISIRTVQRILASLKEKELIIRMGSDKTGYWKVNK